MAKHNKSGNVGTNIARPAATASLCDLIHRAGLNTGYDGPLQYVWDGSVRQLDPVSGMSILLAEARRYGSVACEDQARQAVAYRMLYHVGGFAD